jgi:hypothetical protein
MGLENFERLVERRQLSHHRPTRREVENHLKVGREFVAASNLRGVPEAIRFSNLCEPEDLFQALEAALETSFPPSSEPAL